MRLNVTKCNVSGRLFQKPLESNGYPKFCIFRQLQGYFSWSGSSIWTVLPSFTWNVRFAT